MVRMRTTRTRCVRPRLFRHPGALTLHLDNPIPYTAYSGVHPRCFDTPAHINMPTRPSPLRASLLTTASACLRRRMGAQRCTWRRRTVGRHLRLEACTAAPLLLEVRLGEVLHLASEHAPQRAPAACSERQPSEPLLLPSDHLPPPQCSVRQLQETQSQCSVRQQVGWVQWVQEGDSK